MIKQINKRIENQLLIYEEDLVNDEKILVCQCFVVLENNSVNFNYDVFNADLFEKKREDYIGAMLEFKSESELHSLIH